VTAALIPVIRKVSYSIMVLYFRKQYSIITSTGRASEGPVIQLQTAGLGSGTSITSPRRLYSNTNIPAAIVVSTMTDQNCFDFPALLGSGTISSQTTSVLR
jgi:hypothetical protein